MSDWSSGYVADVEYIGSYYGDLAPALIDFICLMNRVAPPPTTDGRYAYCELGCGVGMTPTLLAAANPQSDFYGVDFNPAHIARARELAGEVALTNLTFLESSFEELVGADAPDLPMFDYVTLHGVYSWVTATIRADIVRFLRQHLKPGGAVFISYNAMPGWGKGIGVQRLLHEVGMRAGGSAEQRIEAAIRFAEKLESVGAGFLVENPYFQHVVDLLKSGDRRYLAHEYLNAGWCPQFFTDVAQDLSEAKLSFVGTVTVLDNFLDLLLTADQRSLLGTLDDPILREQVKDFCTPHNMRRDVFVRGERRITPREQEMRLSAMQMVLKVPRSQVSLKMPVLQGEAVVNKDVYEPIFDALAEGPRTLGELVAMDAVRGHSDAKPTDVASMMIGTGQALAAVAHEVSSDAAIRFNRTISYRSRVSDTMARECFALPLIGTGVDADMIDRLCYAAIADGLEPDVETLRPHVWGPIRDRGEVMIKDGRRAESESENLAIIDDLVEHFLNDSMPLLKLAGAM